MNVLFLEYPKCSTCQKAKKWLVENGINFEDRHIIDDKPTEKELTNWLNISDYDIKRFFNTSGLKYKELNLKEKLLTMSDGEKIKLLAADGILVKRPVVIFEDKVLLGFKEEEWKEAFNQK